MKLGFFAKSSGPAIPFIGRYSRTPSDVDTSPRLGLGGRIAYAIAGDAIAIATTPGDIALLGKKAIADIGFCLEIENQGAVDVTVREIGLAGWFESPRVAEHEPNFHDTGEWPRTLAPGARFVAHYSSGLKSSSVLKSLKRVYVRTDRDEIFYGPGGPVLRYYVKRARSNGPS